MEPALFRLVEIAFGWEDDAEPFCLKVGWEEEIWGTDGVFPADVFEQTGRQLPDRARILLLDRREQPTLAELLPAERAWLEDAEYKNQQQFFPHTSDPRIHKIAFHGTLDLALGKIDTPVIHLLVADNEEVLLLAGTGVIRLSPHGTMEQLPFLKDQPRDAPYALRAPAFLTQGQDGHYSVIDAGQILCFDQSSRKHLGRRQNPALLGSVFAQPRFLAFFGNAESIVVDGNTIVQSAVLGQPNGEPKPLSVQHRPIEISAIVVRADGSFAVAEAMRGAVYLAVAHGTAVRKVYESAQAGDPLLLALDQSDNLYVLNVGACRISVFDRVGEHMVSFGSRGQEAHQFLSPSAIAVDRHSRVYICDRGTLKIFQLVYAA